MKFANCGVFLAIFWAISGCAGAPGEDESATGDGIEDVGEVSSALREHDKACPQKPLGPHCKDCKATKIGSPLWEMGDVAVISGEFGTSLEEFLSFLNGVVGPNHAFDENDFIIGPAIPHAGPYDKELPKLARSNGFALKQTFRASDFTSPNGVVVLLNFVPGAGAQIGSSFDFASGPIIPNSLFPITQDGDLFRNGELYDAFFDGSWAGYPGMNPPILADGTSHFQWFMGENSSFGPPNTPSKGNYEYRVKFTDATGSGWSLQIPFTVK